MFTAFVILAFLGISIVAYNSNVTFDDIDFDFDSDENFIGIFSAKNNDTIIP